MFAQRIEAQTARPDSLMSDPTRGVHIESVKNQLASAGVDDSTIRAEQFQSVVFGWVMAGGDLNSPRRCPLSRPKRGSPACRRRDADQRESNRLGTSLTRSS